MTDYRSLHEQEQARADALEHAVTLIGDTEPETALRIADWILTGEHPSLRPHLDTRLVHLEDPGPQIRSSGVGPAARPGRL